MMEVRSLAVACVLATVLFGGCGRPEHALTMDEFCAAGADKAGAMSAARAVLCEMHFGIDKYDVDAGYVRTLPLSGAQWFEFWRSDNVGEFNSAEANLQTLRRTAELSAVEKEGQVCVGCSVRTERLSLPQRQVSSGQAYRMYSESDRSVQRLGMTEEQARQTEWTDLGIDRQLGTEILLRIRDKLTAEQRQQ
jgi:hypothetical protein